MLLRGNDPLTMVLDPPDYENVKQISISKELADS